MDRKEIAHRSGNFYKFSTRKLAIYEAIKFESHFKNICFIIFIVENQRGNDCKDMPVQVIEIEIDRKLSLK